MNQLQPAASSRPFFGLESFPFTEELPPLCADELFPDLGLPKAVNNLDYFTQEDEKRIPEQAEKSLVLKHQCLPSQRTQANPSSLDLTSTFSPDDSTSPLAVFLSTLQPTQHTARQPTLPPPTNILSKIEFDPYTLQRAKLERQHPIPAPPIPDPFTLLDTIQLMLRCHAIANKMFMTSTRASNYLNLERRIYPSIRPIEALISLRATHTIHDLQFQPNEDKEVVIIANLCFGKYLEKDQSNQGLTEKYLHHLKEPETLQTIVLPALFYQGVFLRSPYPREFNDIWDNFYVADDDTKKEKIRALVKSNGHLPTTKLHYLIVATRCNDNDQIIGFMHVDVRSERNQKVVVIRTIKTDYRRLGIGTTLMNYAYTIAKVQRCQKISLKSTTEGFPLYVNLGFKPENDAVPLNEWNQLTFWEKYTFLWYWRNPDNKCAFLELDCINQQIQQLFQASLQKIFHPTYQNRPKEYVKGIESTPARLPAFVRNWKLIEGDLFQEAHPSNK